MRKKANEDRTIVNGVDLTGIDVDQVITELRGKGMDIILPKGGAKKYRTHTWASRVAVEKALKRWEVMRGREQARLKLIESAIETLSAKMEELNQEPSQEPKENSEFSHDSSKGEV